MEMGLSHGMDGMNQFNKLIVGGLTYNIERRGDMVCMMTDRTVVIVKNILLDGANTHIVGHKFQVAGDYFKYPCPSSRLNIFQVTDLSGDLDVWQASEIGAKCVLLPISDTTFVSLPMK
jgi:hypothetical protein